MPTPLAPAQPAKLGTDHLAQVVGWPAGQNQSMRHHNLPPGISGIGPIPEILVHLDLALTTRHAYRQAEGIGGLLSSVGVCLSDGESAGLSVVGYV